MKDKHPIVSVKRTHLLEEEAHRDVYKGSFGWKRHLTSEMERNTTWFPCAWSRGLKFMAAKISAFILLPLHLHPGFGGGNSGWLQRFCFPSAMNLETALKKKHTQNVPTLPTRKNTRDDQQCDS